MKKLGNLLLPELATFLVRWFPDNEIFEPSNAIKPEISESPKVPKPETPKPPKTRNRIFTPVRTFLLFLHQVLSRNVSMEEVVQKAIGWLEPITGKEISPNTGGYSQARQRLPSETFYDFIEKINEKTPPDVLFHGHKVKVVDGTGLLAPDTKANRKAFPPHSGSGPNSGFPCMRFLAVFSLHTGVMVNWAVDKMKISEHVLFRSIWPSLVENELVMGDRGFCSFTEFAWLNQRRVYCLTRKNASRKNQETIKVLGPNDHLTKWPKPRVVPKWMLPEEWEVLPESLTVREITFRFEARGFRTKEITIVTTLLDESIPAEELAELYRKRWNAELYLRDIKISMGMDMLSCKTPEMLEKEVHMFVLAYNLIRLLMLEAADKKNVDPTKISFSATVSAIREWGPRLAAARSEREIATLLAQFFRVVVYRRLRNRKNRSEPRAKKLRPKGYQLLSGPRKEFKEIPHRNTYHKA